MFNWFKRKKHFEQASMRVDRDPLQPSMENEGVIDNILEEASKETKLTTEEIFNQRVEAIQRILDRWIDLGCSSSISFFSLKLIEKRVTTACCVPPSHSKLKTQVINLSNIADRDEYKLLRAYLCVSDGEWENYQLDFRLYPTFKDSCIRDLYEHLNKVIYLKSLDYVKENLAKEIVKFMDTTTPSMYAGLVKITPSKIGVVK